MGKTFARLLESKHGVYPFAIVGVHTANHGSALNPKGLSVSPAFGPAVASVEEFLERAEPFVLLEITPLNPPSGEPAISRIRSAFSRKIHAITANKGPIARIRRIEGRGAEGRRGISLRINGDGWNTGVQSVSEQPSRTESTRIHGSTRLDIQGTVAAMVRGLSLESGPTSTDGGES